MEMIMGTRSLEEKKVLHYLGVSCVLLGEGIFEKGLYKIVSKYIWCNKTQFFGTLPLW